MGLIRRSEEPERDEEGEVAHQQGCGLPAPG